MKKPVANVDGWTQTDDGQFVKQINEDSFHIFDENFYGMDDEFSSIFFDIIDINDYKEEELEGYVNGFYTNLAEVKSVYPDDWKQVVAEIIAEQKLNEYSEKDFD